MPENEISPEGKAEAEAELKERTEVRRREIVASIKVAREFGDLKENAEYHAAREAQGHNEARIRVLEHHLATATVIESSGSGDGSVVVGAKVSYRDLAADKTSEVTIVHPLEADVAVRQALRREPRRPGAARGGEGRQGRARDSARRRSSSRSSTSASPMRVDDAIRGAADPQGVRPRARYLAKSSMSSSSSRGGRRTTT